MKSLMIIPAAMLLMPAAAEAKGCIRGAIAGGVAGHYMHRHTVSGAVAGCVAGHYYYKHKAAQARAQAQARR